MCLRYHMYRAVYFHKTTRAAEVMLRLMFMRYKDLLERRKDKAGVVPDAPPAVLLSFTSHGKMKLRDYLRLDDHSVTEFAKACASAKDKPLANLADGLLSRRLFKAIDLTGADHAPVGEFVAASKDAIKKKSFDPDSSFISDTPADVPYKPYDPDESKPATQIYVENSLGEAKEFSLISEAVQSLKKKYALLRYYFPPEVRADIESIAGAHFKKEKRS
jgi:HD superfamily phosphohydrolase